MAMKMQRRDGTRIYPDGTIAGRAATTSIVTVEANTVHTCGRACG